MVLGISLGFVAALLQAVSYIGSATSSAAIVPAPSPT